MHGDVSLRPRDIIASMRKPSTLLLLVALVVAGAACQGHEMDARKAFPDPAVAALAQAAADGERDAVLQAVAAGTDPDARGEDQVTPLQFAMLAQSKAGVEALMDAGADASVPGLAGRTAVHSAAIADDPDYLRILLERGADPDARHGRTGGTALADAAGPRTDAQFGMLLDAGADPAIADRTGNTPLHVAAMINAGGHVLRLLEHGAPASAKNAQDASFQAFYYKLPAEKLSAAARAERAAVTAWLEANGVPLEAGAGD